MLPPQLFCSFTPDKANKPTQGVWGNEEPPASHLCVLCTHAQGAICGRYLPKSIYRDSEQTAPKPAALGCGSAGFSGGFSPRLSLVLCRETQGFCLRAFSRISPSREGDSFISACLGGRQEIKSCRERAKQTVRLPALAIAPIRQEPAGRSAARFLSGCFSPSTRGGF